MTTPASPTGSSRISFWLMPAAADRLRLTALIDRLAKEYDAPPFMPHITLWGTQLAKDESPLQILRSVVRGFAPFTLAPLALDHGSDRFKSIFIRVDTGALTPLSQTFRSSCRYPGSFQLDAHLSLLYKQLPEEERKRLLGRLQLPEAPLHFDSVAATSPGQDQCCFDNVEEWRQVAGLDLPPRASV